MYSEDREIQAFGLINNGVICWFNSFIQSLISCTQILEIINDNPDNKLAAELKRVINNPSQVRSLLPLYTVFMNEMPNRKFGTGQEDANEGMTLFLDLLSKQTNIESLINHKYQTIVYCDPKRNGCKHTNDKTSNDRNYFFKIHASEIAASSGLHSSSIPFEKLLKQHHDYVNDYKCDGCKKTGSCVKISVLKYIPSVVIIVFDKYINKYQLDLPHEFKIRHKNGTDMIYKMVSHIDHVGGPMGGHYWTVCKRSDGVFMLNDSFAISSKFKITKNTYIIVYARHT